MFGLPRQQRNGDEKHTDNSWRQIHSWLSRAACHFGLLPPLTDQQQRSSANKKQMKTDSQTEKRKGQTTKATTEKQYCIG